MKDTHTHTQTSVCHILFFVYLTQLPPTQHFAHICLGIVSLLRYRIVCQPSISYCYRRRIIAALLFRHSLHLLFLTCRLCDCSLIEQQVNCHTLLASPIKLPKKIFSTSIYCTKNYRIIDSYPAIGCSK